MPNLTTNFDFNKPLVNDATDADLWGGQLNTNWDSVDALLPATTSDKSSDFNVGTGEFNYTYLIDASGGTVTATLPAAANVFDGFKVRFYAADTSNAITIDGNGSETILGEASLTLEADDQIIELILDASATDWKVSSYGTEAATSGQVLTSNGAGAAPSFQTPIFSESYTSPAQTITSAGSLTLAHGLSSSPTLIQARLICTVAELGYSINDEVFIPAGGTNLNSNQNTGFSLVPDATNLNIRYGSEASSFDILNKTTGARAAITNSSWNFIVYAWV